jgi:hypothetical protein
VSLRHLYHFVIAGGVQKGNNPCRLKYWEIIARNLKKRGWSLGCVSVVDSEGRTIWIVDAHRDGQRFIVRADEKLTAFLELESATKMASCTALAERT